MRTAFLSACRIASIFLMVISVNLNAFESKSDSALQNRNNFPVEIEFEEDESGKIFRNSSYKKSSAYCLSCHDGMIASDSSVSGPIEFSISRRPIGNSHPVDINYKESYLNKSFKLESPFQLDPKIKLDNGKISCLTCHDENSDKKHYLVVDNRGSKLCFSCHNL